jgi:Transposase
MGGKGHCGPVPTDTLDATAADHASGLDSTSQGPVDSCGVLTILTVRRGPVPATRYAIGPEGERACAVRYCPVRRLLRGPAVVALWGEVVLGVDTHRDAHVAAVLATGEFPATATGYRDLLKWARKPGSVGRAGVEGTGSYGASLSRYLLAQGVDVFDVNRMDRADRRRRGKSDPLDAQNAARAVLSGRACARAKTGDGPVQIARMYKLTKASAVKARTQAINQLKSILITADPALWEELAGLGNAELFRTCARFADVSGHEEAGEESVLQATRITWGLLAHRIGQLPSVTCWQGITPPVSLPRSPLPVAAQEWAVSVRSLLSDQEGCVPWPAGAVASVVRGGRFPGPHQRQAPSVRQTS